MGAEKIRVNTNSLKATQSNIKSQLDGIQGSIGNIVSLMAALNSSWTGTAHDTFVAEVNEDIELLQNVCKGIQSIIDFEGNAVTEYNNCEQQVSGLIAQIHV